MRPAYAVGKGARTLSIGTCMECGKQQFTSRKEAKRVARLMRPEGGHLAAYQCGEYWHLGHLPRDVVQGERSRDEIEPRGIL